MKNGKKPTKKEKIHIESHNLNSDNWLIFKKLSNEMHLVHRDTNTTKVIPNA
ncbi:hypothetical protein P9W99_18460 [Bacillus cereus]|uniref:DUF6906 domain-containing protein n=1 Tax=Bacillus cereus ISP2954 TaxID=1053215 RepID=A0A9W5QM14_BACCE|nr:MULTISPECIES: hypothetical protein [Bacillus cereus group]AGE75838.1 hypothetical protein HD73_0253 [Bacillus thuringiensis serovar kurstaki str. HD73]AIE31420.1 hypothetical protein BTK_01440 [Bacillus thuringiensis serovar kurstaki str. HD-1]AJK39962.1 hypothetical protein BG08_5796 [Bacillus thuringiensis serovar kurstaki]EEM55372.1 hypothetical protein bthur0006_2290 [Bacillus thuringiensis serovar kurstaki str. T03a001]EJV75210.1 hypothetical protein IG1_05262 [Bacillus cereus HD73]